MVWNPLQRDRLAIEKETLDKYFRFGVEWIDPQHETKVEVVLKSNSDNVYKLRIYIPADFPNSCPVLVVVQPKTLLLRNGTRLPETSYTFHTLPDNDGFHRICHFYPPDWTPDITLYQVFMKGRLWIEAYEGHLSTGKDMDAFLKEQKEIPRTQYNAQNMQRQSLTAARPAEQQVNNSPLPVAPGRNASLTRYSTNPLNSSISPLPTAGYANDPVDNLPIERRATYSNPASSTRRRNNLNSARSISLGRLTSPRSTASYVNEPVTDSTSNHRGSPRIETTNLPQPCYEGSAYDVNYNEEASAQNEPAPEANERPVRRYIPAGGVLLLPPFSGQNTLMRRVPPKPKAKPRR